jgi:hypothetical protein
MQIWDLRTGAIFDAYAYTSAITSMQFDARRIVAAAGEPVVKVYDKTDGHHWDCGAGAGQQGPGSSGSGGADAGHDRSGSASSPSRAHTTAGGTRRAPPPPAASASSSSFSAVSSPSSPPLPPTSRSPHAASAAAAASAAVAAVAATPAIVERVRLKDGYLVEGRKDGVVGIWAC